jgi:hypothetical protein
VDLVTSLIYYYIYTTDLKESQLISNIVKAFDDKVFDWVEEDENED